MRLRSALLPLLALPFLSGCINDGAPYMIDGRFHAISMVREQPYFWDSKVKYYLVVARLPDCQRKHFVALTNPLAKAELWDMGGGTYALKLSKKMYVTETRTCEGFAKLDEMPAEGLGTLVGHFKEKGGQYQFFEEPKPEPSKDENTPPPSSAAATN